MFGKLVPVPSGAVIPERDIGKRPILNCINLGVTFGGLKAVDDFNLMIGRTEIAGLIGPNGAGKTTTLNTISGLLHSKTGHIEFMGEPLNHVPSHKVVSKGLALVPEGRRIFLQMSVQENLDMGAFSRRGGNIDADMERVFEQFPRLKERRKQVAGTLSGGEQQMLAMGRALMSNPKLLMLDEPSMGLAPILVEQIFDIIKNLHKAGTTILLVEQNAQAALSVADRGYVLETGKIVTTGTGAELLASPAIKKAYLGGLSSEQSLRTPFPSDGENFVFLPCSSSFVSDSLHWILTRVGREMRGSKVRMVPFHLA